MKATRAWQIMAGAGIDTVDTLVEEIFGYLPRADQRRWAHVYLRGLLLTEGKKSMRRLAESVSASPTAWYSLQQFINSSPWEWEPARDALNRWVEERSSVRAWTLTPVALPKRGGHSVGVHQRFVNSTGRRLNCQLGIALFLSCPGANFPIDWRLFLPRQWTDDPQLRRRARIPETESFQPQWKHMLDLVGSMATRSSSPPVPVVADMSDATDFRELTSQLDRTGRDFVVAVHPRQLSAGSGSMRERTLSAGVRTGRQGRADIAVDGLPGAPGAQRTWSRRIATVTGADGRFRQAQILSTLVPRQTSGGQQTHRLFTELDAAGRPSSQVWLTNLVHHRLDELLELTRLYISSTVTADLMDGGHNLLDFAGRSFPAWHHHMTMASAAYTYMRLAHAGHPMESLFAGRRSA
ncbi:transposase [Streptomyces stelliscabiei]|uniref:IS701 family transposase n=1 Tax=Streptomyces stelliscabiei TaxID=146820 RepID=UPI0029AB4B4F|nr:transposase [Streptomyces stelliscabiei]MDX2516399.1 transposase [Streptomyces stelliscabiei]